MSDGVFIHPSSDVAPGARIGKGTKIWQHCTVLAGAEMGSNCLLSQNVFVEGKTRIGHGVKIKNNVAIYEGVELDDDVFVGPSAVFTNVLTPRSHWPRKDAFQKTIVGKGATIGANATVVCGVKIGRFAMIGAGSVVTRDVEEFALVHGCPARQRAWVCHCGEVMKNLPTESEYICPLCRSSYRLKDRKVVEIALCGLRESR
jgi:UDP-2-acetamido-3-amino-2,3-dideoxy-glucuronate N-acetyltransferase